MRPAVWRARELTRVGVETIDVYGGAVVAPGFAAGGAALVLAVQELADVVGQLFAIGLLGFNVHGVGPLVVGGDGA
jgi:hypothetical protein